MFQSWPIIYVLMTRRTSAAYVEVLRYIEDQICKLNPKSFMSDFEFGLRRALRLVYPGVKTHGCWFHLKQAVQRHANRMPGFLALLRSDPAKYRIMKKFSSLPLLPANMIGASFLELAAEAKAADAKFEPFIRYFKQQWIEKVNIVLY